MCMEGITAQPTCALVPGSRAALAFQADADPATNASRNWKLRYDDACGRAGASFPLSNNPLGSMEVAACTDAQGQAHLDWVFLGWYAQALFNEPVLHHVQCAIHVEQAAAEMNLSRNEINTMITPALDPQPCPLTSDPADIVPNLTSHAGAILATIADQDGGLLAIGQRDPATAPLAYLESLSGVSTTSSRLCPR